LDDDVEAILPRLPETFTLVDVCGLLDYTPNRGSLYRVLRKLRMGGQLTVDSVGSGTQPTRYRKATADQEGSGS
jgi:prophage antirepressor-like protein